MSIIVNGTNIPNNGAYIYYNGVDIDKVVCNGVNVWEKQIYTPGTILFDYNNPEDSIFCTLTSSAAWDGDRTGAMMADATNTHNYDTVTGFISIDFTHFSKAEVIIHVRDYNTYWDGTTGTPGRVAELKLKNFDSVTANYDGNFHDFSPLYSQGVPSNVWEFASGKYDPESDYNDLYSSCDYKCILSSGNIGEIDISAEICDADDDYTSVTVWAEIRSITVYA